MEAEVAAGSEKDVAANLLRNADSKSDAAEWNILFTSAGRRVALVRHFRETLAALGIPGQVVTADLRDDAPAHFVADARELVPRVNDPGYVPALLALCKRHRIRLVVPLIDTELPLLAEWRERFAEEGVTVLVSSPEVNRICCDKRNTAAFFAKVGVSTPPLLDAKGVLAGEVEADFPLLLKPAAGSSSVGVTKIFTLEELAFFSRYVPDAIVQPFVEGEEYTLDVLVDFAGAVRSVVPRRRIATRAGEISKGRTVKDERLIAAGRRVVEALPGAVGCITVQCFLKEDGEISFIEINPRFGGGIPLSIAAGADFPRWILQMMRGESPEMAVEEWTDGMMMLRFDEAVFLEPGRR